ncbi:endonuclease/exonuclease/phosphatase family protein [Terrabacter sp. 2RAF25]|uniref:endonuclease/exonuclease/phosphatase family protein n=1 Tax=Terrabacter sp. 2RAF25 TaxID=3232998 RepID=UPI003F994448
MSYNVHDLRDDTVAASRVVRTVAPDVLCLQEVPRRLTTEIRLPRFARACGMAWGRGRLGTGGTAVLVSPRVVLVGRSRGRLPVRFPDRTRGYAAAVVTLPGAAGARHLVTVVSVHLGLRADERVRHTSAVLQTYSSSGLPHPASSLVVAGDLNEGIGGRAYAVLADRLRRVAGESATFPAHAPTAALDVVFASPDLAVVEGAHVAVADRDLSRGSDHRPVWVDLDLRWPATEDASA